MVLVPLAVFSISAFFGLILWGLECEEAKADVKYVELPWHDESNQCSYFQWWIYM